MRDILREQGRIRRWHVQSEVVSAVAQRPIPIIRIAELGPKRGRDRQKGKIEVDRHMESTSTS